MLLQRAFVANGHGYDGDVHHLAHKERLQGHRQQPNLGRERLHRPTAGALDEELEARVEAGHEAADKLLEHVPIQFVVGELATHVDGPRPAHQFAKDLHVLEICKWWSEWLVQFGLYISGQSL